MHKDWLMLSLLLSVAILANAQQAHSPYAGQESREIKALSAEEVQQYLTGQGMGFAKAAELNRYPGPKHVLGLAEQLTLAPEQASQTWEIRAAMNAEAIRLGRLLVEKESKLDRLFAQEKITEQQLNDLVSEIAQLQGRIRATHLKAHLEMKHVLTQHQVHLYDQLGGYGASHSNHQHGKH